MKTGFLFLLTVSVVALFVAASRSIVAQAGPPSVLPADRLSIERPQHSAQWKGNDLSVEYSYSKDRGQMDLLGTVRFSYAMTMGYTMLKDFRLSAIFLDENGKVLKEVGLATNRDALEPIPFSQRITLPLNAVSMTFSYQGTACDLGRGRTSFWFDPIH